jgi:serine/threonine protein kinase
MPALEELTLMHYHLRHRLAQGGMSEIYLAEDTHSNRLVAIKLVSNERHEFYERFQREVEAMALLTHDHILPAFDYGTYGPWYYMVMPYIEYGTLRDKLMQGPLTLKEAGMLLEQIADALQFAHDHGLLHRDIKPSNILLRDGEHVYLADFGLVKNMLDSSNITQTGCLIGTPEYMAPELAEEEATPQSDIYALGVVLYQMLTGQMPFKSRTPMGIYWKHLREQPIPPSQLNPAITRPVEQVVLRALEKDPHRRFPTTRAFADAYRQAIEPGVKHLALFDPDSGLQPRTSHMLSIGRLYDNWYSDGRQSLVRVTTTAIAALLILCVLPTILGFALYRNQSYRQVSRSNSGANVPYKRGVLPVTPTLPHAPPTSTANQRQLHPVTTPTIASDTPFSHSSSQPRSSPGTDKQGPGDHDHSGLGNNPRSGHGHERGHRHGHGFGTEQGVWGEDGLHGRPPEQPLP